VDQSTSVDARAQVRPTGSRPGAGSRSCSCQGRQGAGPRAGATEPSRQPVLPPTIDGPFNSSLIIEIAWPRQPGPRADFRQSWRGVCGEVSPFPLASASSSLGPLRGVGNPVSTVAKQSPAAAEQPEWCSRARGRASSPSGRASPRRPRSDRGGSPLADVRAARAGPSSSNVRQRPRRRGRSDPSDTRLPAAGCGTSAGSTGR